MQINTLSDKYSNYSILSALSASIYRYDIAVPLIEKTIPDDEIIMLNEFFHMNEGERLAYERYDIIIIVLTIQKYITHQDLRQDN